MEADISKKTHYNWLNADAAHAAEYAEVAEDVTQTLEHEARCLESEGWEDPVYYKGKVVGHVRKFSDVLLIFLLKARRPEVYRERQDLSAHVTGKLEVKSHGTLAGNRRRDADESQRPLQTTQVGRHLLREAHHRLLRIRSFRVWDAVTCAC